MSKRDVLDEQLAARFRWRTLMPGDPEGPTPDLPPLHPAAPPKPPPGQVATAEREGWERATRACAALAQQVQRTWEMTPHARQAASTVLVLERARTLGFDVIGLREHPVQTVRLWRLIVRHYRGLPRRDRKASAHALSFVPISPRQPEIVDLLAEAAAEGDPWLAFLLEQTAAPEAAGQRHPALGARLATILDEASRWTSREIAARWLSFTDLSDAGPALRRALRRPHARIRWIALETLLERAPAALPPDDVLWLLEDAVNHPLPRWRSPHVFDTVEGYGDALITAVATITPPDGCRPLALLADGGGVHLRKHRHGLNDAWALRALAAAYPEHALARIDRALADPRGHKRRAAAEAAGCLPEPLARPRLLEAAAGPGHAAAELAQALWFKRFGAACPVEPAAGVQVELLSDPPQEPFFSRLAVLRGHSDPARAAMLEVLLAEAPPDAGEGAAPAALAAREREALVLLLFSLREPERAHGRPAVPAAERPWAELLLRRFGEPAFDGLLSLSARGAKVGVDHAWLGALTEIARKGLLTAPQRDRLRALAAEALSSPAWDGALAPLIALTVVGAPPELLDRLWSIATPPAPHDDPRAYAVQWAADALVAMNDAPALDLRVGAEGADAFRARAYPTLEQILHIGCRRRLPAALDLAERCVACVDDDPAAFDVARSAADALAEAERIDEAWLKAALQRPASSRFAIAARLVRKHTSLAVLDALHRALESPARAGAAAAEAAEALVAMNALASEDPRLDGILASAPERARGSLAGALLRLGAPLAGLRRHVVAVLLSDDATAAAWMFEDLHAHNGEGVWEVFESTLRLGVRPKIRDDIAWHLGEPHEAELYWQDGQADDAADEDALE